MQSVQPKLVWMVLFALHLEAQSIHEVTSEQSLFV
jgi:hypothetical protein